jgi:hypothetical protein
MNQTWLPTSTVISGSGSFPNALDEKNRLMALSTGLFQKVPEPSTILLASMADS